MAQSPSENTNTHPVLGRILGWVDRPGSGDRIFWALVVLCGVLFVAYTVIQAFIVAFLAENLVSLIDWNSSLPRPP